MSRTPVKDSFLDIDRHLQLLQENVSKLRKALTHWQTWSAEYEGLKEEVQSLPSSHKPSDILSLIDTYEADLVTKPEIEEIIGVKGKNGKDRVPKRTDQIINVLERRIDYVVQNIQTVEKQLLVAEEKLEKVAVVGRPEVRNEDGEQMMEIYEELDEDGNVIEGRVEAQGSSKGVLEEVLKKAGIDNATSEPKSTPDVTKEPAKNSSSPSEENAAKPEPPKSPSKSLKPVSRRTANRASDDAHKPIKSSSLKKSVSFAEEDEIEPEPETAMDEDDMKDTQRQINEIAAIMEAAAELNKPIADPVIPANETAEDARLRAEMLKYGMSDVQNIVAELDIEDDSEFSDEGYDDEDEDTESLEDEDVYGRSIRTVINDDIRAQMIALEKKLGIKSRTPLPIMQNVGPDVDIMDDGSPQEVAAKVLPVADSIDVNTTTLDVASTEKINGHVDTPESAPTKKAVRFAEELDIASPQDVAVPSTNESLPTSLASKSVVHDITERSTPSTPTVPTAPSLEPKKQSRFKASRNSGPAAQPFIPPKPVYEPLRTKTVPTGPIGKTLADTVVEKDIPLGTAVEPDEYDPALLHQQVATDYYTKRNRMIQKQGGFKGKEEEEERTGRIEFTEEEGGRPRVSRFMAARLARQ